MVSYTPHPLFPSAPPPLAAPRILVAPNDSPWAICAGYWLDAAQPWAQLASQIERRLGLSRSVTGARSRWSIIDSEGFEPWTVDPNEDLTVVAAVAQGINDYGPAFGYWVDHFGTDAPFHTDRFCDHFLGFWPDLAEFAAQVVEDFRDELTSIPSWLVPFVEIDLSGLGRHLTEDLLVVPGESGIFIFCR